MVAELSIILQVIFKEPIRLEILVSVAVVNVDSLMVVGIMRIDG